MLIGCIADDFTGASDLANALSRGGLRTLLAIGIPPGPALSARFDAVVIALKSRSVPVDIAVDSSLHALDWLQDNGAQRIMFKYCSTFDSSPAGNIGPVAEALADSLAAKAPIICPSFPQTGRTVYQGHLFVGDSLLSNTGMATHPINPMTDSDIRRWLATQTSRIVEHIPFQTIEAGPQAIRKALDAIAENALVVTDAVSEAHISMLASAVAGDPLITGGSAIGYGLAQILKEEGMPQKQPFPPVCGPGLVLSGSCSSATQRQVAVYATNNPAHEIDVPALLTGRDVIGPVSEFLHKNTNNSPLLYSTSDSSHIDALNSQFGRGIVSSAIEDLFRKIAQVSVTMGFKRLIVAGGETSGATVSALGISTLLLGPEIDPGVPALHADELGISLALKSGNFGSELFFEKALSILESGTNA